MAEAEQIEVALAAIRRTYIEKLPAKVKAIVELWDRVQDGDSATAALRTLYEHVHQMCGTGATVGLPELSTVMSGPDQLLRILVEAERLPTGSQRAAIEADLDQLKQVSVSILRGILEQYVAENGRSSASR